MKKIALVTEANKGIGLEICRQLAHKGFHVLLGSRDEARGRTAAALLAQNGAEGEVVIVDVGNPVTFEMARKLIADRFGRLDVLINNAGIVTKRIGKALPRTCRSTHYAAPLKPLFRLG
jgi:NAD(P)-dependent dehydrogenase (short-subunit alcohol dehydrogenase family)